MLLVLQSTHRNPPTEHYHTLLSLVKQVVHPYMCLVTSSKQKQPQGGRERRGGRGRDQWEGRRDEWEGEGWWEKGSVGGGGGINGRGVWIKAITKAASILIFQNLVAMKAVQQCSKRMKRVIQCHGVTVPMTVDWRLPRRRNLLCGFKIQLIKTSKLTKIKQNSVFTLVLSER